MPTLSFEVTAEQVTRARAAFGRHLNLTDGLGSPRPATSEEIRQWTIARWRAIVLAEERALHESQIVLEPFDPI